MQVVREKYGLLKYCLLSTVKGCMEKSENV